MLSSRCRDSVLLQVTRGGCACLARDDLIEQATYPTQHVGGPNSVNHHQPIDGRSRAYPLLHSAPSSQWFVESSSDQMHHLCLNPIWSSWADAWLLRHDVAGTHWRRIFQVLAWAVNCHADSRRTRPSACCLPCC